MKEEIKIEQAFQANEKIKEIALKNLKIEEEITINKDNI